MKLIFVLLTLLFSVSSLKLSAQNSTSTKTNDAQRLGELYIEVVGIDHPSFPCWANLNGQISFDQYVAQVKNWILANPQLYYAAIQNHDNFPKFNSFDLLNLNETAAASKKHTIDDWGMLFKVQKDINKDFDTIKQLSIQYSKLNPVHVFLCLVHKNDLTTYFTNL